MDIGSGGTSAGLVVLRQRITDSVDVEEVLLLAGSAAQSIQILVSLRSWLLSTEVHIGATRKARPMLH